MANGNGHGLNNFTNIPSTKNTSLGIPMHPVPEIEIAELTKIIENAHRYLQIAFAEDLYLYCQANNINFAELRDSLNTKWNVNVLEPREGIGGHCLPKDTKMFLNSSKSIKSKILEAAIEVDSEYRRKRGLGEQTNNARADRRRGRHAPGRRRRPDRRGRLDGRHLPGCRRALYQQGIGVTVVDQRWVKPVPEQIVRMAAGVRAVVVVEDGLRGGVSGAVAQALRDARVSTPLRDFGVPLRFLDHAKRAEVLAEIGLTAQDIARDIVETVSEIDGRLEQHPVSD